MTVLDKKISRVRPSTWLSAGARLVGLGVFIGGSTRALAYSGVLGKVRESPGPQMLSDDGSFLWFYSALWMIAAILGLYNMFTSNIGVGLMLLIPLITWWACSYFFSWVVSDFHAWDWMTAGIYFATLFTIVGLLLYIKGLRRQIEKYQDTLSTSSLPRIGRGS